MNLELKLFFFALLILSTPLQGSRAHAQTKVYIGLSTLNSRVTPLWIAQEKGFFAKNGLEILLVLTRVSQPAIAGLLAGEMQMVYGGSSAAFSRRRSGSQSNRCAHQSLDLRLVARPGIFKPLDLRGKKIGVGSIDAALLDGIFTQRLRQKGFSVVAELYNANIPFAGQGVAKPYPSLEGLRNVQRLMKV
jgi:ABC-type nitrate/sulfonate/bicarbonate transport system substrate-binding protein